RPQLHFLEIANDSDLATGENFDVFLGIVRITDTRIDNARNGTIYESQMDREIVPESSGPALLRNTYCANALNRGTAEIKSQIDKVAAFANESSSSHVRIVNPMIERNCARIDANQNLS